MSKNSKFYIVEASALPEIFLKVAQARELIQTGEAKTVNEATTGKKPRSARAALP